MVERTIINSLGIILLVIATSGLTNPIYAESGLDDIQQPENPLTEISNDSNYEYILEGRPDPFNPFLSDKASTQKLNPDEIIEEEIELTGMRQFEPGQLNLVAVMRTNSQRFAMVEDVTGKGYLINEGTLIGRRGIVTQIETQQVLITETAYTRAGKEIKNSIVMRLKKEGEQ